MQKIMIKRTTKRLILVKNIVVELPDAPTNTIIIIFVRIFVLIIGEKAIQKIRLLFFFIIVFRLSEKYIEIRKKMLREYPLPVGWKEIYDTGVRRHYCMYF